MNTTGLMKAVTAMATAAAIGCGAEEQVRARLVVQDRVLHALDQRVFGQFMERAVGGDEYGPEAALKAGTRQVQPEVVELARQVAPSILRFPGGSDVEYGPPWTHLIDGAYDRPEAARPVAKTKQGVEVGNEFGIDEFLRFCGDVKAEPMLVVSMSKSFHAWEKVTLADSIRAAQAMVAYCNAATNAALAPDIRRWAELRAKNGRAEPYRVRYWQIGNEPIWGMAQHLTKEGKSKEEVSQIYVATVGAFIRAMREVDPAIEILVDTQMEESTWVDIPVVDRVLSELGDSVQYLTCHVYAPWSIDALSRAGQDIPPEDLTPTEFWYAAMSVPTIDAETGLSCYRTRTLDKARKAGRAMGVTEWNWNGWWKLKAADGRELPNWQIARGVGSAGFIHAFIREGDTIRLATQSMFVGVAWSFAAIHVDRERKAPPYLNVCGKVVSLYARNHGNVVLPVQMENVSSVAQPIRMGGIPAAPKLALLDPVATRDEGALYVHVINRDFDHDVPVEIELAGFATRPGAVSVQSIVGELVNGVGADRARVESSEAKTEGTSVRVVLPKRSVSLVKIALTQ